MSNIRVLVDCDGVMADFADLYLDVLGVVSGRYHSQSDITAFEFKDCIASEVEDAKVWSYIAKCPGLVQNLAVLPGVAEALEELRELGEVVCVTNPQWGTSWGVERFKWLQMMGFDSRSIVYTAKKSLVDGDFLVDDNHAYLAEWAEAETKRVPILVRRPWNAHSHFRMTRRAVDGLPGAVAFLKDWIAP